MLPNDPQGTEFFQVPLEEADVARHVPSVFFCGFLADIEYFKDTIRTSFSRPTPACESRTNT